MIIFERKYERAKKLMDERTAQMEGRTPGQEKEDVDMSDLVEKGDVFAMIVSALITFLPVALIVLGLLAAAGYFFLVR